jgi:diguanylate cyclase (GGDEF)-like protein
MIWLAVGLLIGAVIGVFGARFLEPSNQKIRVKVNHDPEYSLDVLRRAHRARMACLVGKTGAPALVGEREADKASVERMVATARLAMNDRRKHVSRIEGWGCVVALGSDEVGVALVLDAVMSGAETVEKTANDLARWLDSVKPAPAVPQAQPAAKSDGFSPFSDSLSGVAYGVCERAQTIAGHPAIVVVKDQQSNRVTVVAHSSGADRRMLGTTVPESSLVARACFSDQPITGVTTADLLGDAPEDRRREDSAGFAIPIREATRGLGALVVFRAPELMSELERSNLVHLATEIGPDFAAAAALKAAKDKAETDPLTGLPNRSALQRAMGSNPACASIVAVDLDHFKRLNDSLGHAAGDGALQHVASIFMATLRDRDVPARVGGEEFALWLPGADLRVALEIAERVRLAIAETPWEWAGTVVPLSASIGVAAAPDSTSEIANLMTLADGALYRAKEGGRNRVMAAAPRASGQVPPLAPPG